MDGILLVGFSEADGRDAAAALGRLGRAFRAGRPLEDRGTAFVLAAAYEADELRGLRAAALDDERPWAFCVPAADRPLVAAAAAAREGHALLLPFDDRELKRVLSFLGQDARERSAGVAAFSGLERLDAAFAWHGADIDISRVSRAIARLLAEAGFYADRSNADECALALEEALINAVEHGNLGLDSSLKPNDLLTEDLYEKERRRRLEDPELGCRPLKIALRIGGDLAEIEIEDAGEGFDTSRLEPDPEGLVMSGRGYSLIRKPFDSVSYNAKGNKLTLAKRKIR